MLRLDEFVLREACRQHQAWASQGLPQIRMAVNVSLRLLSQPDLDVLLAKVLAECDMPPEYLELEIAERDAIHASNGGRRMLELLHAGGVRVAVDGFARGYAVPNHLHGLPIDTLKINRCAAGSDEAVGNAVSAAVLELADALSLETVVECVETDAQLDSLAERKDLDVQGYVFCRPASAEEMTEVLRSGLTVPE